jgi:hypothetical protein
MQSAKLYKSLQKLVYIHTKACILTSILSILPTITLKLAKILIPISRIRKSTIPGNTLKLE